jgi:AcrR family transcriptional regulator
MSAAPLTTTERAILDAAMQEFEQQGFDGARMQRIANRAGVNKALLHYYFRSKERLHAKVAALWAEDFETLFSILDSPTTSLTEKLEQFVFKAMDLALYRPATISRIEHVTNGDQSGYADLYARIQQSHFAHQLQEGRQLGLIRSFALDTFILLLLSSCCYPARLRAAQSAMSDPWRGSPQPFDEAALRAYYAEVPQLLIRFLRGSA